MKLDLSRFRVLNVQRAQEGFKTYRNVPITYWTTALAGEVGELCNMIKKMERVIHGGIDGGSSYTAKSLTDDMLAEEIGGIFIYLDLLASLLGISLEKAIIDTFNSKSEKYGFAQKYNPGFTGIDLIAKERQEQIGKHCRYINYDVNYNDKGQLSFAALALISEYDVTGRTNTDEARIAHYTRWKPLGWDADLWLKMISKPYKDRLIIAGALIAAEIDRLQNTPTDGTK